MIIGYTFGHTMMDSIYLMRKCYLISKNDPHEQYNLALEEPGICMEAVYYLNQWHDEMMKSMPFDVDPLWTVMKEGGPFHAQAKDLKKYVKHLEETGRGWAIPELKRRHPKAFEESKEDNFFKKGGRAFFKNLIPVKGISREM
ncbi:hypothetical protein GCM10020331_013710 [Ectobacillus funiculus]